LGENNIGLREKRGKFERKRRKDERCKGNLSLMGKI
jgi:hypothetical protein